ncbi:MAG: hemolysin family protein [Roseiflexaceae bacterium]|jgi:putative hemolysin|nr:hemolysin family protein [Chloroflexaceae bacterium]
MGEELTLIVALILANGIFAGTELAMVSARRGRLQQKADDGSQGATAALALQDDPNRLLSTVQVGITVISTLTGVFGGAKIAETLIPLISVIPYVASYADTVALALVVLIISYLSLVLGELVPKRLALQHAEWIAVRMAVPMTLMAKLSRPLVWLLTLSTELLLKLAGQRDTNNSAVTEDDIRQLVREGTQSGAVEHHEREIIEGVFGLGERTVRQVMTPRTDVYALEANATIGETVDAMLESGYSRAPVYEKDLDHVVGVVHARDVLRLVRSGDLTAPVKQAMRTPWFIPEQSRAATLLGLFKKNQQHLAIVVGELGTVEGIITLEDIMEEIVGDIADEYDDAASPTIVRREDGSYLVDGTTPIDDVVERTELAVRDGESARFDTVAGYALMLLGRIPQSGDIAEADGWRIEVVDMDGLRIDKVLISRL